MQIVASRQMMQKNLEEIDNLVNKNVYQGNSDYRIHAYNAERRHSVSTIYSLDRPLESLDACSLLKRFSCSAKTDTSTVESLAALFA